MNFRQYKQRLRELRKEAHDFEPDPDYNPSEWGEDWCPQCQSPMYWTAPPGSGVPQEQGAWLCSHCGWRGPAGWNQTPEEPSEMQHPDPWMDNEPGSLTLPAHWGAENYPPSSPYSHPLAMQLALARHEQGAHAQQPQPGCPACLAESVGLPSGLPRMAGDLINGPWRGTGVPPHVKVYEPDHEYEGEVNEHHYDLDPHDEFDSIPEQAAGILRDHGLTAPSMAPGWGQGLWYTHPDEGGDYSGHLNGLNPQQEREVWAILQSQNDYRNRAPDTLPPGNPLDWS